MSEIVRAALFVPGSNARALQKARALAPDAVILDLEDAVAPEAKIAARETVCALVAARAFAGRLTVVRVNAPASPWGEADVAAIAPLKPDAILVPKVSRAADLAACEVLAGDTELWAMIETPRALLSLREIAGFGGRLRFLVLGANDLLKEMGARPRADRANLHTAMTLTVSVARAFGLGALDAVHNDYHDAEGFIEACALARDFGFDGKTLIHPDQIEPALRAFSPSLDEIAEARALLAAFARPENADAGAIAFRGRMAERLDAEAARRLLARAP